ncbi:MAG: fatty acid desaturase [Cytophagales bacterium]|nr:MAG: fatty acid desaturase [Cytophagales bacterium]
MRSGKELILATKTYTNENRYKSWYYTFSTLLFLIISLCLTYWNLNNVLKAFFSLLSGLLLIRMFVIYHDHQHHAILYQSKLANVLMKIFSIYILAPTSVWKRSHDFHHNHNSKLHVSDIGSFPTITKAQYLELNKKEQFYYLALRHPLNIFLGYLTVFMYSFCIQSTVKSFSKHWDCLIALIVHFTIGFLLVFFGGVENLFLTLIIPHLIACGLGSYLFYVQHNFPTISFAPQSDWRYVDAALESTSYFKMNRIMRWFTGNIGYHHVHHLNSRIPFYRLEEAMQDIPELQDAPTTSFNIKEILSCLSLKLWDAEHKKMITLKEI